MLYFVNVPASKLKKKKNLMDFFFFSISLNDVEFTGISKFKGTLKVIKFSPLVGILISFNFLNLPTLTVDPSDY